MLNILMIVRKEFRTMVKKESKLGRKSIFDICRSNPSSSFHCVPLSSGRTDIILFYGFCYLEKYTTDFFHEEAL